MAAGKFGGMKWWHVVWLMGALACSAAPEAGGDREKVGVHEAAWTGDLGQIQHHVHQGANLNEPDAESGDTPLHFAVMFGHTEAAVALLDAGADINARNQDDATPLHMAAFFCRKDLVEILLTRGADASATDRHGDTPRQSIERNFTVMSGIYRLIDYQLGPLGLELDLNAIERDRPVVAAMLP